MALNSENLQGLSTSDIVEQLLQHVVKTPEELREEKEEKKRQNTDLKVFISKKEGFRIGSIEDKLEELATDSDTHQNTVDFIDEHGFSEIILNENTSLLEVRTPSYERADQAILIDTGEYLRTLTIERRYWTERTIERVLDYLPGLSRLYLSADDIRDIVNGLNEITETEVSGFTSKYQSYKKDRKISIQFHGGDDDDIRHVRDEFDAKPTRVEFRQKNSPTNAVTGAITRDARINVPGIRAGSEQLGAATVDSVATRFEELDRAHFDVPNTPKMKNTEDGLVIEGFTTIRLEDQEPNQMRKDGGIIRDEEVQVEKTFVEALEEDIFDRKQRYEFTEWVENEDYLVLDLERHEMFQVGIEGEDLVINARPGTTPITLKDFCRLILEEFKTTYSISTRTQNLANI